MRDEHEYNHTRRIFPQCRSGLRYHRFCEESVGAPGEARDAVSVAEALAKSGVKLVPDIVAGGGATGGTLVDVLLANVIRDGSARNSSKP